MESTVSGMSDSTAAEAPASRAAPAEEPASEELARLEALLAERAAQCRGLSAEVARRGELCRDLSRQLERLAASGVARDGQDVATDEVARLLVQRDRALEHALEAEAARAVTGFERDEALGQLARLQARGLAQDAELEQARLSGARRGLMAALAEAQEARDVLDARLLLAQQDLEDSRMAAAEARRALVEARDQRQLEAIQLHTERGRNAELALQLETLQGERAGLSSRAIEADQALALLEGRGFAARERLERAQGDLTEAHTEAAELKVANANLARQLEESGSQLRQERQRIQDLAAEISERDHLIARVESDLSLAQNEAEGLRRGVESLDAQRSSAELVRETVRTQHVRAEQRVDGARAALHDARDTLEELRSVLGSVLFGSPDALGGPVVSTRSEQATLPGVAIDPAAFDEPEQAASDTLDRKDAEVSEQRSRVAALLETLEMERDRLRAVDSSLRTLRPLVRDPEIVRRLDELLQLLGPSSPT